MKKQILISTSILFLFTTCGVTEPEDCAGKAGGNAEFSNFWYDGDGDGLGSGQSQEFCDADAGSNWVSNNNDENDSIFCLSNNIDCTGNCDGNAQLSTYWYDGDGDGLGSGAPQEFCDVEVDYDWVLNSNDENDNIFCLSNNIDCCNNCDGDNSTCETLTDIDSNVYCIVEINSQIWMAENLKTSQYSNGDPIQYVQDESTEPNVWGNLTSGAFSFYNDDLSQQSDYGKLYNWFAVTDERNVCPDGWHVPTDEEFIDLEMSLGMSQTEADSTGFRGANEGSKLAGKANHWADGYLEYDNETGISGFNAIPAGYRTDSNGSYSNMDTTSYFWTSSGEDITGAWHRRLSYFSTKVFRLDNDKNKGFSVRCLKD